MTRPGARHQTLLQSLATPGCPACRRAVFAESRFVSAFVTTAYTDYRMLDHLRASLGFCPEHTRLVLRRPESAWVMPIVYAEVVSAAAERAGMRDGGLIVRACPLCESRAVAVDSWLRVLVEAAAAPPVSTAYRTTGGLCVAHARIAVGMGSADAARVVVATLADQLDRAAADPAVEHPLLGLDGDRDVRGTLREQIAALARTLDLRERELPVLDGLAARFAIDACPLCVAGSVTECRALAWVAGESLRDPDALVADGVWLCARHLHDVQPDAGAAGRLAGLLQRWVDGELERLGAQLAGAGRIRRSVMASFATEPRCFVCTALAVAERREQGLLAAALQDRPTAARYDASHGACVHHAIGMRDHRVDHVIAARLAVLQWELEEARRLGAWPARFDVPRGQRRSWERAAGQLDGRTYLGGPPIALAPTSETDATGPSA